jgi:FG-GAP repeat
MRRSHFSTIVFVHVIVVGAAAVAGHGQKSPAPLRQIAYLKASNTGMFDHFGEAGALDGHTGNAVAVSADGNTIAVGAQHESSSAGGVNGNQNDDSAYNADAVYVFARLGSTWAQQAYITASNAEAGDRFGNYVAPERRRQYAGRGSRMGIERRDWRRRQPE